MKHKNTTPHEFFKAMHTSGGIVMSYQALYRKYRPRIFSEVTGQEHITTTLKNQVKNGHTSHAYLFCGSRGTGKTSTAKILARALNCEHPRDGEPCMECAGCLHSADENVDIVEMDAASNSRVEEMRELLEKTSFMPLALKKKVYIIDEAHMLSNSAFNALLKTLEEPPSHVAFILATTEPHKLPATIISRCQRFDFHRLRVHDIISQLTKVLSQAGVSIDRDGLTVIARSADGGMRDALSLADQCLAFCGDHVTASDVYNVLGSMEEDFLFRIADALIDSDASAAYRLLDEIVMNGRDIGVFAQDLTAHFRALLMALIIGDCTDILDCTEDTMKKYTEQAKKSTHARLMRTIEMLLEIQSKLKWIGQPRVLLESTLVRICEPEQELAFEALLDRVERLEKLIKENALPIPASIPSAKESKSPTETWSAPSTASPVRPAANSELSPKTEINNENQPRSVPAPGKPNNAGEIWQQLLKYLSKENVPLYVMASYAKEASLQSGVLHAFFEKEFYINALEKHKTYLSDCINNISNGTGLKLELIDNTEKTIEKARELFGDKLEIVD